MWNLIVIPDIIDVYPSIMKWDTVMCSSGRDIHVKISKLLNFV